MGGIVHLGGASHLASLYTVRNGRPPRVDILLVRPGPPVCGRLELNELNQMHGRTSSILPSGLPDPSLPTPTTSDPPALPPRLTPPLPFKRSPTSQPEFNHVV